MAEIDITNHGVVILNFIILTSVSYLHEQTDGIVNNCIRGFVTEPRTGVNKDNG